MNQQSVSSATSLQQGTRFSLFTFFFAQGLCMASWASRIPDFKEVFSASFTFWGVILFMIPVGKFVALPLASYLISRLGSATVVQISIMGYAFSLIGIGWVQQIYWFGACLFVFGVFWNLCDISFNAQGIEVERLSGKTIMATFHGGWSLGACAGALIGFLMILSDMLPMWHYVLILAVVLLIVGFGRGKLLRSGAVPTDIRHEEPKKEGAFRWLFRKPELLLLQLGLVGLFGLVVESAMFDWSGVYFKSVVGAPESLQIGFLVFMLMMVMGRFLSNFAYGLWGKKKVLQVSGWLIFTGFFVSALLGDMVESTLLKVAIHSLGLMLVGLGISSVVPTLYSFVSAKSKTPVGIAITILSSISFMGSLIAPLLIGAISEQFGIKTAYMIVGTMGFCIVLLVSLTKAFDLPDEKK